MKNILKMFGVIACVAVIGFIVVGCKTPEDPVEPSGLANLKGTVTISPNEGITTGKELTAIYDGKEKVSYQWYKDGEIIPDATEATYTPLEEGDYTVTVSAKGYRSINSARVAVARSVLIHYLSGTITVNPYENVTVGTKLTATYDGGEDVSYQWFKDYIAIPDATNTEYTPTEAGNYTVTVKAAGYGEKTSPLVRVTGPAVIDLRGTVVITPNTALVTGVELFAEYSGLENISYQWNRNTTVLPGMTLNRYTPGEAGSYTVTVSAFGYNSKTGAAVTVTQASPGTFSVGYNTNGATGTAPPVDSGTAGRTITLASGSGLSKDGYTFGGWNTNASGTGNNYAASSSFIVNTNVTLYARWISLTHTITFDLNGGSGTALTETTISAGSDIILPGGSGLFKAGYTFDGWNTEDDGTGTSYAVGFIFTPSGDITFYAKWLNNYTVTFDANGGIGVAPVSQTVAGGSSITLPRGSGLSVAGKDFSGWNTRADNTGTSYAVGSSFIVSTDVTLYANWVINQYTVTFNANGGTPAPAQQTVNYGFPVTELAAMTRTGHTFGGWFKEPALNNPWNLTTDTVTQNITLYARWIPIPYTVTFNSNGGSSVATQTVNYGSTATRPGNPILSGNTFENWYTEEGNVYGFSTTPVTQNITLYAKWATNSAGITLSVQDIEDVTRDILNSNITIYRTAAADKPGTLTVTVPEASNYSSIRWEVAGVGIYAGQNVTGIGASFTLDAGNERYGSLGGHALILTVIKNGMTYQKAIPFTIGS